VKAICLKYGLPDENKSCLSALTGKRISIRLYASGGEILAWIGVSQLFRMTHHTQSIQQQAEQIIKRLCLWNPTADAMEVYKRCLEIENTGK